MELKRYRVVVQWRFIVLAVRTNVLQCECNKTKGKKHTQTPQKGTQK